MVASKRKAKIDTAREGAINDMAYRACMKALEDYDFRESTRFFDLISLKNEEIDRLKERVRTLENEREELEMLEEMDVALEGAERFERALSEFDSDITEKPYVSISLEDYAELVGKSNPTTFDPENYVTVDDCLEAISELEAENLALREKLERLQKAFDYGASGGE